MGSKNPIAASFLRKWEKLLQRWAAGWMGDGCLYHQYERKHLCYPALRAAHPSQTTPESPAWTPQRQQQLLGSIFGHVSVKYTVENKPCLETVFIIGKGWAIGKGTLKNKSKSVFLAKA